jgi:glycosyltransferase involved in cell wall biosynthesis
MSQPDELRVGVVGGTRLPGNVRAFLRNVRRLLDEHPVAFELELIARSDVDAPDGFKQVDPGFDSPGRALGTLNTLVRGITDYAEGRKLNLLFQVTKFPLHGCATAFAGRWTDTPVLTRFAGDNFREFRLSSGIDAVKAFGLNNLLGRIPIYWSDRVIVLGPHGRGEIESRSNGVSIVELHQPVNFDQFFPVSKDREYELARAFEFPTDRRIFLTVGRLTERKGITTVIETAKQLRSRGESFRWYVIGDGPMRTELSTVPSVEPLGRIDFDAMADYYRAADLVVHPSLIEGLPNVLIEAAACGTPTVARDVGDSSLVASATFEEDPELLDLLTQQHDAAMLGKQFEPAQLRKRYASTLIQAARER